MFNPNPGPEADFNLAIAIFFAVFWTRVGIAYYIEWRWEQKRTKELFPNPNKTKEDQPSWLR